MKSFARAFDWTLNGVCLLVAVLSVVLLVRRFLPTSATGGDHGPLVGDSLNLPGTDWSASKATLVMALQIGCHWCEASAKFYQDLLRSDARGSVHPVAVFPGSPSEARRFLKKLKIDVADVRQRDLSSLGVQGTPTLILVDATGKIIASWVGLLSPDSENEVFRRIGVERPKADLANGNSSRSAVDEPADSADLISASEFVKWQHSEGNLPIIDIRPRPEFGGSHIVGSLNIPMDELEARAIHEVPRSETIVMYCHYCPPCENTKESEGTQTYCKAGLESLQELGFSDVRIVNTDLRRLDAAGVKIEGLVAEPFMSGSTPVQASQ